MLISETFTTDHWLAILRIIIGLWWIKSVLHKDYPKFIERGMMGWTTQLLDNHPWPAFAGLIRRVIHSTPYFPHLVVAGEAAVGIGLTLGLLTPISAIIAMFMNLNYLLTAGVEPKDISVNPCFRVDQGQNIVMIAAELIILATGAWAVWSLDSLLGFFPI